MKIGFTGTRKGVTPKQLDTFIGFCWKISYDDEFHHGDCIGADASACAVIRAKTNAKVIQHPPLLTEYRAFTSFDVARPCKSYLERNKDIVNESDLLIAMPFTQKEEIRSGTWFTIRYARRKKKPVFIIFPDGSKKEE